MTDLYRFELGGYRGSVRGINGTIMPLDDKSNTTNSSSSVSLHPIAQSCVVELRCKETYKLWRRTVRKEELNDDGGILQEISDLVSTIHNALDVTCTSEMKASAIIHKETSGKVSILLCVPCFLRSMSTKVTLEEVMQDNNNMSMINRRFDSLTERAAELATEIEQAKSETKHNQTVLEEKITTLTKQVGMLMSNASSTFFECGENLHISKCGTIVTHIGQGANGIWGTAIVSGSLSSGKHYVEFMTLCMNSSYSMLCGVIPSNRHGNFLNTQIGGGNGNYAVYLSNGRTYGNTDVKTSLRGCSGRNGKAIVGVMLNLENNKMQYYLNGVESEMFDVSPGEYHFALSLYYSCDSDRVNQLSQNLEV